jgi:hypothetical protein
MEVHQTEFLQAVALAGAVALAMTVWDKSQERVSVAGTPKTEARKDHVRADNTIAPASKTRVPRNPIALR